MRDRYALCTNIIGLHARTSDAGRPLADAAGAGWIDLYVTLNGATWQMGGFLGPIA